MSRSSLFLILLVPFLSGCSSMENSAAMVLDNGRSVIIHTQNMVWEDPNNPSTARASYGGTGSGTTRDEEELRQAQAEMDARIAASKN